MALSACFRLSPVLVLLIAAGHVSAAQPSESLLPNTTKGYIATHDVDEVREKFNNTDLGAMVADPVMKPFIDDLKLQIGDKMEKAGNKLGIKWEDLEGVYGGEAAIALIQPDPKDKTSHCTALVVDVTGKKKEVDDLLAKIAAHQETRKATKTTVKIGETVATVYTQVLKPGEKTPERSYLIVKDDMFVSADNLAVITGIVGRFGKEATDSLGSVVAFQKIIARNEAARGDMKFHVRWFVEPFGFAEANRAAGGGRKKRGTDMLKIFQQQGFTAIQGAGGYIFFDTEKEDILHRTLAYAPAVTRKAGDTNKDKYDLAMRMLNFPNGGDLEPQKWVMSDISTHLAFNMKMREAFDYSETLVDAIVGDVGVFDDMWKSLKIDPHGPKVDIYAGLVNHLGERGVILSDITLPIDVNSERDLVAIEVRDSKIVAETVEKAFKGDPAAKKRVHNGQVIWEIINEVAVAQPELSIEGSGEGFVGLADEEFEEEKPLLPNMAITVFDGYLMVSTHYDFLTKLLDEASAPVNLGGQADYQRTMAALKVRGSAKDSFRFFSRTAESYRPTYDLIKQNKLPQGETMFARLINGMFGPAEEGVVREREIDGQKLPAFELVEKYLGPAGAYVQSEEDGWFLVGIMLEKNPAKVAALAETPKPAETPESETR